MPQRAPSACRRPGCRGLVRSGVCSVCGVVREQSNWARYHQERNQESRHKRGYGNAWEKLRNWVLQGEPYCRQCKAAGRISLAATVDHIIPKAWGGTDDPENLQSLCTACHRDKTVREVRGRLRRSTIPVTVVAGPPGCGKSTYVAERRQPGDLVWDSDEIFVALSGLPVYDTRRTPLLPFVMDARHAVLLRLARTSGVRRAWVLTTEGDARQLRQMVDDLGATLVVLAVPESECMSRIEADVRRDGSGVPWRDIVAHWWNEWRSTGGEALLLAIGTVGGAK